MGKIIANDGNLNPHEIQVGVDEPNSFNRWEKISNEDGSFYLFFIDEEGNKWYLENSGEDTLGVGDIPNDRFIQKDNTIVHYINKKSTNFTLNILNGYLSDKNTENFTDEQRKSTVVKLVDNISK